MIKDLNPKEIKIYYNSIVKRQITQFTGKISECTFIS